MNDPLPPSCQDANELPAVPSSVWANMANVIATPGDVFSEVKTSPASTANWLVPVLVSCLAAVIYVVVVFSQETILQQLREANAQKMQARVEQGQMSQQQADQALEMAERFTGPVVIKIMGSVGAVFGSFIWLFFIALLVWLLGCKVFHGSFSYLKAVEVCALAGMVGVISAILTMLLVVATGNIAATLGPGLLLKEPNPALKAHAALYAINLLTWWYIAYLGLGLSKLSGASFWKSFLWLFVPYGIFKAALLFLGIGQPGQ